MTQETSLSKLSTIKYSQAYSTTNNFGSRQRRLQDETSNDGSVNNRVEAGGNDDWRTWLVGGAELGDVFEIGDEVSFGVVLIVSSVYITEGVKVLNVVGAAVGPDVGASLVVAFLLGVPVEITVGFAVGTLFVVNGTISGVGVGPNDGVSVKINNGWVVGT